MILEESLS